MKNFLLIIGPLLSCFTGYGQWLTQSGDGKGTVLFKGSNLSLDATTTELSASVNNLISPVSLFGKKDNHNFFFGGDVKAKSANGLGNLFSTGDLVPDATLNGFAGFRFSNTFDQGEARLKEENLAKIEAISIRQQTEFPEVMERIINETIKNSGVNDNDNRDLMSRTIIGYLTIHQRISDFLNDLLNDNTLSANAEARILIKDLIDRTRAIGKENVDEIIDMGKILDKQLQDFKDRDIHTFYIFAFGGINAMTFKRVGEIDPSNLKSSFIKEEFRGGRYGLGVNFQKDRFRFGITFAHNNTNNFSTLTKTDYKLTKTTSNTTTSQSLVEEQSIAGYAGAYGPVNIKELNLDLIWNLNLNSSRNAFVYINPYFRSSFNSNRSDLLPDNYTFGLGTYFFKRSSKFLGGLYFELPDVEDAKEKILPVADQNLRTAIKRFSFGIVTKFSLAALIGDQ